MKRFTTTNWLILAALTLSSFTAFGYDDDKEKEKCRNPKIQEFTLPVYEAPENKEAPPEAEFSFVVSGWANPKKIKLSAKEIDIPFTVKSTDTFHKVNAKLPAEFTGKFIRMNARIPAVLGCYSTIGWLIKVADKPKETAVPSVEPSAAKETSTSATPASANQETVPAQPNATPVAAEPKNSTEATTEQKPAAKE
ncbi:MAG: hypothetical protein IPN42_03475 [Methylococcaceae bacterium]|nr:hypothetical protein [Methylococcaceae bacterium]